MSNETKQQGEGNREADRRYRENLRETVEETTDEERAEKARALKGEERAHARAAELEATARAKG